VASGGGENASNLQDRLYVAKGNQLVNSILPDLSQNAAVIKAFDYDKDGDLDLFVANNSLNNRFGSTPDCYLLKNNNGVFGLVEAKTFEGIGMVTDAVFSDFNKDGKVDLIIVGEWMKPTFFANTNGKFINVTETVFPEKSNGLYQSIIPFDIDNDGDQDYLVGNWGTNSKFNASQEFPMKMYYDDFDKNGTFETIVAKEKNGKYYTTMGLDELVEEFSGLLKKKFNNYKTFAGKPLEEVFDMKMLEQGKLYEVHNLKSGYLRNDNGKFVFIPFVNKMQVSPITSFVKSNFDGDAKEEVFAAGNYFGVSPYHSRFDGFSGAIIKNDKTIFLGNQVGINLTKKAVRHLNIIHFKGKKHLLVTINNEKAEVYELPKSSN
jgi:enediyne biosynthesis protein E4